jgi:type II secretory pathway pseudopilin PulG
LIVVAIISILAAIAVPNFIEAQNRAKVSRAKSDMRTLATGIESYYVDWGSPPVPADESGVIVPPAVATLDGFETFTPTSLTTPVSYVRSLLDDPFFRQQGELGLFHYASREYFIATEGNDAFFEIFLTGLVGAPQRNLQYYIMSHGPDGDHDSPFLSENPDGAALYDPSNGSLSSGDIIYFQGRNFVN